jgi:hypothetical protein
MRSPVAVQRKMARAESESSGGCTIAGHEDRRAGRRNDDGEVY